MSNFKQVTAAIPRLSIIKIILLAAPLQITCKAHGEEQEAHATSEESVDIVEDNSISEAIERRPDLKFDSIQIDGQKSSASLESISAEAVKSLESLKVPTPDMDADTTGGAIKIEFRPSYENKEETARLNINTSYNKQAEDISKSASLTYGQSFDKRFGYILTVSYEVEVESEEEIDRLWMSLDDDHIDPNLPATSTLDQDYVPENARFEKSDVTEDEFLVSINADYKISDTFSSYVRLLYEKEEVDFLRRVLEYELNSGVWSEARAGEGQLSGGEINRILQDRFENETLSSFTAGLRFERGQWQWETRLIASKFVEDEPDRQGSIFTLRNANLTYNNFEQDFPRFNLTNANVNDLTLYEYDESRVRIVDEEENKLTFSFDLSKDFQLFSRAGILKTGIKIKDNDTSASQIFNIYDGVQGGLNVAQVVNPWSYDEFLGERYSFSGFQGREQFRTFLNNNIEDFELNFSRSIGRTDPATFDVQESIYAAYLMSEFFFDKWRTIVGVRVERTENDFTGNEVLRDENGVYVETRPQLGENSYTEFFPGIHFAYSASDKLTIYSSITKAIRRPDYVDLVPSRSVSSRQRLITEGNPNLRPLTFNVFELSADYQYSDAGFCSLEFIHESQKDILVDESSIVADGPFAGFRRETSVNGAEGELNQFKFRITQGFSELSQSLAPFSVDFSWIYSDSETDANDRIIVLPSIPRNELQTAIVYRNQKFNIRLNNSYETEFLDAIGDSFEEDIYFENYSETNLLIEYDWDEKIKLIFDVSNIDNNARSSYFGDENRPRMYRVRGRELEFGVRINF